MLRFCFIILMIFIHASCSSEDTIKLTAEEFVSQPEIYEGKRIAVKGFMYQWTLLDKEVIDVSLDIDPLKDRHVVEFYWVPDDYKVKDECNNNHVLVEGTIKKVEGKEIYALFDVKEIINYSTLEICWSIDG